MAYKKFLIVADKNDPAGANITTQLSQFQQESKLNSIIERNYNYIPNKSEIINKPEFKFHLIEDEILHKENLDEEKINQFDFIIFASKHISKSSNKTLCIHAPGNPGQAKLGGEANKFAKTSAQFSKQLFEKLHAVAKEHNLDKYKITLEATHHGPLIDKPCVFVEIGSTETEWKDRRAGFVVAKAINKIIQEFKINPYNEIAVAIGGPHYCPNFNKLQLNSNVAISHVIPEYALPLTEEMVRQALEKTDEEVDLAVLDWKGLGNKEARQQVVDVLDKMYVRYERSSVVGK